MSFLKYRLAYVLTPIEFGGAQRVSLDLLLNVNRKKFEISPILFFRPWEQDTFFLKEIKKAGFSAYTIPVSFGSHDHLWLFRRFSKLFSFLRQNHFDLLHTHGYVADILGIPCANLLTTPVVSTCHGFIENDRKLALYNRLDRFILRFCDEIIAVSIDIRNLLVSRGIKSSSIRVIPNAVATNIDETSSLIHRQTMRKRFAFSETDFVLGYAGRLSREKGLLSLIEAVSLTRKAGCPAKLLIVGEGSQRDELEDAVRKQGLEDAVVFAGFQSEVDQFLSAMDAFVLPSLTEGTPIALLEAMAHGIPAIASAVGQIPEIIDPGKNGLLAPPGKVNEVRDAILLLYNNPSIRQNISKVARKTIEDQFDIKIWVKRIESEYLRVIKSHRGS